MRIHTLEATKGFTYSQMGRFQALDTAPKGELAEGGGTDNPIYAATDPKTGQPVANGLRDLWVTETALTTALNTSFFAERVRCSAWSWASRSCCPGSASSSSPTSAC